ncbi:Asp23/Gls24 family envelope stress response protein [Streptomyces broussonetiae]|uniref:Asp23/Gls24 family envelope stress response protein n=1 Tax=Streptomyces broussonetiae TaxID=2686304 RepID=UPI001E509D1F|nr:Asp23/Gls24 family envelope stress response protein [Streptomyces broussonetiae]
MSAETAAARPRRPPLPPGERGALRIADRVVAKIAAQAAREALPPPPADAAVPHATVVVHHDAARVRVYVELGYPCDIGAHCAAVRRQVAERVSALVDMEVPEVAVRIERLHLVPEPGAVHGRA